MTLGRCALSISGPFGVWLRSVLLHQWCMKPPWPVERWRDVVSPHSRSFQSPLITHGKHKWQLLSRVHLICLNVLCRYRDQRDRPDLGNPESMQLYLDTRFEQLKVGSQRPSSLAEQPCTRHRPLPLLRRLRSALPRRECPVQLFALRKRLWGQLILQLGLQLHNLAMWSALVCHIACAASP